MSSSTITERGDAGHTPGGVWAESADAFDRWIAGDPSALDDLVRVMTPVLWHVVRAYRLDAELAEDVIQSTWLAFVRRSSTILDTAAVGGWLTMTARREAWRVATGAGGATRTEVEELAPPLPRLRWPDTVAFAADRRRRLWGAVDGLPERCRRLLRVVAFENRPDYASLASELGMPIGSIGPTRGRCLAKLRVALIEAGEL